MSIATLTNSALARRPDYGPQAPPPPDPHARNAASGEPQPLGGARAPDAPGGIGSSRGTGGTGGTGGGQPAITTVLQTVTRFVPTEILSLYLALVATASGIATAAKPVAPPTTGASRPTLAPAAVPGTVVVPNSAFWIFVVCAVMTPVVVWLLFAAKLKHAGKPLPGRPAEWPMWEMIAATLAFVVWAVAAPASPAAMAMRFPSEYTVALPLVAGLLLPLLDGIFGKNPLPAAPPASSPGDKAVPPAHPATPPPGGSLSGAADPKPLPPQNPAPPGH